MTLLYDRDFERFRGALAQLIEEVVRQELSADAANDAAWSVADGVSMAMWDDIEERIALAREALR